MRLDPVHDIQSSYRKLVESMSRPGVISDLSMEAEKLAGGHVCFSSTLLIVKMLLDTEVTFKVISEREAEVTDLFTQLTYAKPAETHHADYILILQDADQHLAKSAIHAAKIGDLLNPHHSATIVMETREISGPGGLKLTGPGIKEACLVNIQANIDWVEPRDARNAEYPLGIDFMFMDDDHRLLCLPRTTRVVKQEG